MKKAKKNFTSFVIAFLLIFGLILMFNNQIKNSLIKNTSEGYNLSQLKRDDVINNKNVSTTFDFKSVQPISSEAVIKAKLENKKLPVIGAIAIPEVGINLPVFKGLSNDALLWGAGTTKDNEEMGSGNYGLASHYTKQEDLLFTPLLKVKINDEIYLTDLDYVYHYKVSLKREVSPSEVQWLDEIPNKELVTLVTCGDLSAETRIIIQGELQERIPINEIPEDIRNAFELEQLTY